MSGAGCWHNHQLPNKSVSLYHCAAVFGVATPNVGEATKRVGHRRKRQFVKNRKCCLTASYGFGNNPRFWFAEGFPSGQREQTVNLSALPSKVRILLPPPTTGDSGFFRAAVWPGGCSSMVEQKPSKLKTRVRSPSPAPRPLGCSGFAHVAQWQSTPLVRERSAVQSCPWAPGFWWFRACRRLLCFCLILFFLSFIFLA